MKIQNLTCATCALLFCMLTFSCNKNKEFDNYNLLVDHEWQLQSVTNDGVDITKDCELDNVLIFENKTKFDNKLGTDICDSNDKYLTPDCWILQDNFTTLKLNYKMKMSGRKQNFVRYWEIVELTESTLILQTIPSEFNNEYDKIVEYRI